LVIKDLDDKKRAGLRVVYWQAPSLSRMQETAQRGYEGLLMNKPTMQDIRNWMDEGGCEAVCDEGCWVEHDGYCPHGNESWFLKLGLI